MVCLWQLVLLLYLMDLIANGSSDHSLLYIDYPSAIAILPSAPRSISEPIAYMNKPSAIAILPLARQPISEVETCHTTCCVPCMFLQQLGLFSSTTVSSKQQGAGMQAFMYL